MAFITRKEFGQRLSDAQRSSSPVDAVQKLLTSATIFKEAFLTRADPSVEVEVEAAPEGAPSDAAPSDEARLVPVTFTMSSVDRDGDLIVSAGTDVSWFAQFGSVIWAHNYRDNPYLVLGRAVGIQKLADRIVGNIEFVPELLKNPYADYAYQAMKRGFISGVSVGVRLLEVSRAEDRAGYDPINVLRCELVELSVLPCPAHAGAVRINDEPEATDETKDARSIVVPVSITETHRTASVRSALDVLLYG
jgi:HK97 family phage prohead protease